MPVYDLPERWRGCGVPVNNFPTNKIFAKWFLNIIIRLTEIIWYDFGNRHRKAPQESQALPTTCHCQAWSYHNKVPQRGKCPSTWAPFTRKKKKTIRRFISTFIPFFYILTVLFWISYAQAINRSFHTNAVSLTILGCLWSEVLFGYFFFLFTIWPLLVKFNWEINVGFKSPSINLYHKLLLNN